MYNSSKEQYKKGKNMDFTEKYTNDAQEKMLLRKTEDMIRRSEKTFTVLYSHFLTPAEQMLISGTDEFKGKISFDGGFEDAERKMCRIQTADYQADEGAPYKLLGIKITAAESDLSHRDYLGALMGLGIKREMVGDIIVKENGALVFCDSSVADFIEMNLEKIGRYRVNISSAALDEIPPPRTELKRINVSTPRIDSVCAESFGLSRTKAAEAIRKGLVTVDWQVCDNVSRELRGGEKIAMRHKGKIKYIGITGTSKKGRTFAEIEKYI